MSQYFVNNCDGFLIKDDYIIIRILLQLLYFKVNYFLHATIFFLEMYTNDPQIWSLINPYTT